MGLVAASKTPLAAFLTLIIVLTLGCSRPANLKEQETSIPVKVSYLQPLKLPPDAVLVVQLRELSGAGAPPRLVAERQVDSPGQVPISVNLRYDRRRVDPYRRYEVAAWIHQGEWLPLMSGRGKPVLTGRFPDSVDVVLHPSR